ncbi:putative vacuolar protein sorting-associated protein TDA6 [Cladophialophora carrionii]|uniref:Putative vacuolar protein sorting-associated protein TDA6 n=1 Tax=Cladophialophora carrionii TaxID=86049 RepID=A0A1C1C6B2_9EURO|nr:putative vacuolar protein sorting-associated protein TDA6 [Cladophialophora carrionii]
MVLCRVSWALALLTVAAASPVTKIQKRGLPDFVRQYAPVAYLHSQEVYFPSSIAGQLIHTHPVDDTGADITTSAPLTLDNLDTLNAFANGGQDVYLTSNEGIQALPAWFQGTKPSPSGSTGSTMASVIVTVAKPDDVLDAFYFSFYAYNQGNAVLGLPALLEFGDHVGDWEHTMLRFVNGTPQAMWFSQHSSGQAFTYAAVEKYVTGSAADGAGGGEVGLRPVVYVAKGSHANYATPGSHDHTIPGLSLPDGPLEDHTDAGIFWDPLLPDVYEYDWDASTGVFTAYDNTGASSSPTTTTTAATTAAWLAFLGRWGDAQLPDDADGQVDVFGQRKYTAGPTGPVDKDLGRQAVCPGDDDDDDGDCMVRTVLTV